MPRNKQLRNNEGSYTLPGIYNHIKQRLNKDYRASLSQNKLNTRKRISLNKFSKVVRLYLTYCLKDSIDSFFGVNWFHGHGTLRVVSYIPNSRPVTKRYLKNNKVAYVKMNLDKTDGYFSYMKLMTSKTKPV